MNRRALRQQRALIRARAHAGWANLSDHAAERAHELGFHETEILACLTAPENTYPCHPSYGPNRKTYQRGDCCCIVETTTGTVITVLLRTSDQWDHGHHTRADVTTGQRNLQAAS